MSVQEFWTSNSTWIVPLAWVIVSALINWTLRMGTPEQWAAWAQANPRLASLIRLLSALGVDLSKAIVAAQRFAEAQARRGKQ